jgi:hypothetical protein
MKTICVLLAGLVYALPAMAASEWLGTAPPGKAYPQGEEDRQFTVLTHDLKQRNRFKQFAPESYRTEALILDADRDPLDVILRRAEALLADLTRMPKAPDLAALARKLADLRARAGTTDIKDAAARRAIFNDVCHVRREIAFANPLLDFTEILFIKRHLAIYDHMCDQYYGICQRPGGGVFVLSDAFGAEPALRDVLENSVVGNGRLKGQALTGGPKKAWKLSYDGVGNLRGDPTTGGSFLSPDLSFDGKQIAFAFVECTGRATLEHHTDPSRGHWSEGRSYHCFKANLDGSGLTMLTDGTWNDFDPCFMPSGRICFTSERRGGYLRCGRACPTYTLYDMAADGSDIRCLSFHETNEWHPSVTNDGMIVWTRWDYVDRHGCVAHHPWVITPDGRDPRAIHGNYSVRGKRADMQVDLRAIPDSPRFVSVGAPHHGQSFGSIVLSDPRVKDDDAMGPVKRVTPDVGFPESQGGFISYGQPWPLSEDYYLCVYEPAEVKELKPNRTYALYLLDAFGNKELIYRDPEIACHSPIPVKARRMPPVIPDMSQRAPAGQPAEGTIAIVDVYNSYKPWPDGTKIKALRVYQILPLPIACTQISHATGVQIPQGNDSINLARSVLGTVPVEEDGSAHFVVPARRELFFQVLDENGLAITSMRSAAQLQPGEKLVCQGCHEPRHRPPVALKGTPLAMRKPPARLQPDVDGTNPFSYPRLVQPVLDKHCVDCHAKESAKACRLDRGIMKFPQKGGGQHPPTDYFASYVSLAPKFGFYDYGGKGFGDEKFYRTTPGQFGARASKLYALLQKGHYDVKLSPEELHRITVWLDSCSIFYGVYEKDGGKAILQGDVAKATLE